MVFVMGFRSRVSRSSPMARLLSTEFRLHGSVLPDPGSSNVAGCGTPLSEALVCL